MKASIIKKMEDFLKNRPSDTDLKHASYRVDRATVLRAMESASKKTGLFARKPGTHVDC